MKLSFGALLAVLLIQNVSANGPLTQLVTNEQNQRRSVQVGNSSYYLLPFRLTGSSQTFIQVPQHDQYLYVEATVHWISNNTKLRFPEFDLTQKVRLVIDQYNFGAVPKSPILIKQFLTQTGFKVQLSAGRRYRWKIESSGAVPKLVEIAMINKANKISNAAKSKEIHEEVAFLRQMSQALERAKLMRIQHGSKLKESKVANLWAWMSGIEIVSLLGFLLVQLALFQKFMLPNSVV